MAKTSAGTTHRSRAAAIGAWSISVVGVMLLPALVMGAVGGIEPFLSALILTPMVGPISAVVAPHWIVIVPLQLWNGSAECCGDGLDFLGAITAAPFFFFILLAIVQKVAHRRVTPVLTFAGTAITFSAYATQLVIAADQFAKLCAGVC